MKKNFLKTVSSLAVIFGLAGINDSNAEKSPCWELTTQESCQKDIKDSCTWDNNHHCKYQHYPEQGKECYSRSTEEACITPNTSQANPCVWNKGPHCRPTDMQKD